MQLHEVAYLGDDLRRLVVGCRLLVVRGWSRLTTLLTTTLLLLYYYSTLLPLYFSTLLLLFYYSLLRYSLILPYYSPRSGTPCAG